MDIKERKETGVLMDNQSKVQEDQLGHQVKEFKDHQVSQEDEDN
jgi:hypothetical protein